MADIDILVADDEPHIARALNFIFKKEGYKVEMAFDGEAAMRMIKEYRPKVVYLDMIMPKRNGDDICREIKQDKQFQDIHVVILTAKGQELDKVKCIEAGTDEFITKPFSPKEVVDRVKAILDK